MMLYLKYVYKMWMWCANDVWHCILFTVWGFPLKSETGSKSCCGVFLYSAVRFEKTGTWKFHYKGILNASPYHRVQHTVCMSQHYENGLLPFRDQNIQVFMCWAQVRIHRVDTFEYVTGAYFWSCGFYLLEIFWSRCKLSVDQSYSSRARIYCAISRLYLSAISASSCFRWMLP